MPTYDWKNKETGEIITNMMKIADLDKYKEDHPELERYFGDQSPNTIYGKPKQTEGFKDCLLYTSPSPRDRTRSRMPSSA